jgi:hypothetical protein
LKQVQASHKSSTGSTSSEFSSYSTFNHISLFLAAAFDFSHLLPNPWYLPYSVTYSFIFDISYLLTAVILRHSWWTASRGDDLIKQHNFSERNPNAASLTTSNPPPSNPNPNSGVRPAISLPLLASRRALSAGQPANQFLPDALDLALDHGQPPPQNHEFGGRGGVLGIGFEVLLAAGDERRQ